MKQYEVNHMNVSRIVVLFIYLLCEMDESHSAETWLINCYNDDTHVNKW